MLTKISIKAWLKLRDLRSDTEGASMAEYAVLLAIIAGGTIAALGALGVSINSVINGAAGVITWP